LTGISLCNVCSCHEKLRRNDLGQGSLGQEMQHALDVKLGVGLPLVVLEPGPACDRYDWDPSLCEACVLVEPNEETAGCRDRAAVRSASGCRNSSPATTVGGA
jgi:hypothetical protein